MAEHKVLKNKTIDTAIDASGKSLFWKFIAGINKVMNPGHAWTDYQSKNDSMVDSWLKKESGAGLTAAEIAANQFSADEAQKQRDWEEWMSNTAFQRQVKDMQAAGVNPALAISGGASTPSGSAATSVSPSAAGFSFSDLMSLILLPVQKKLIKAQAQQATDQGKAALINAGANVRNAGTNERNAGTQEKNASTNRMNSETERMRVGIEKARAESQIRVADQDVKRIAEQTALIKLQREQLPEQLNIAKQNATSEAKRAIAALQQADAAVQNAATNDRLADYETSLKYTQELLTWYQAEGQKVIAENLPERTRAEIDNLIKEGVYLDKRGQLVDRQGHLVTAQTVKTYVNVGTDISGAVNQWLNPLSKGPGSSQSPGFDLSGAYQGVAYGYE